MQIAIHCQPGNIRWKTYKLLKRSLGPLCGLNQTLGFISRSRNEPRVFTIGVELSGVHILNNSETPKRGSYHIGGNGIYMDEALIRALGESIERYSQLSAELYTHLPSCFASYQAMVNQKENILSETQLNFFSKQQYQRKSFPFSEFNRNTPMMWINVQTMNSKKNLWVPMQLIFVGYQVKIQQGEPWLNSAVTTGTATHENHLLATRSAILELIQIDAAMGHWYTSHPAYEIQLDKRTQLLESVINKTAINLYSYPKFYWLPTPDLCGITIACMLEKKSMPFVVFGLGADTSLISAMYRAYLEAQGVTQLAKLVLLEKHHLINKDKFDLNSIFNLDQNVGYYASQSYNERISSRFLQSPKLNALDLPADDLSSAKEQLIKLINSFSGKDFIFLDLTCPEANDLGLAVSRVWSPDTLSLTLPSAAPLCHPRFEAYGGVKHDDPHPYP